MRNRNTLRLALAMMLILLVVAGCAAGNQRFVEGPAGFWAGLWHGLICFVAFIISLFADAVQIYELNNTGGWYDFGFVLGVAIAFSSGAGPFGICRKKSKKMAEKDWEEIGKRVEERVRTGIRSWLDESDKADEWEEIGRKIEEKIKRELRNWAEK